MKASEAKELTLDSLRHNSKTQLGRIFGIIKLRAEEGQLSARCDIDNSKVDTILREEIIKILKSEGYDVEYQTGYDQRDGDSRNYLLIKW